MPVAPRVKPEHEGCKACPSGMGRKKRNKTTNPPRVTNKTKQQQQHQNNKRKSKDVFILPVKILPVKQIPMLFYR